MRKQKILIYGSGNAREHATYEALRSNEHEIYSLTTKTNALLEKQPNVFKISNISEALKFSNEIKPDKVLILGPEELISGAADIFRKNKFDVFGASQKASILEHSKSYSKEFMTKYGIPTPEYFNFYNKQDAYHFLINNWGKKTYVLKTDIFSMNAYDRTVTPESLDEAIISLERLYLSNPNAKIIIEEMISGYELSAHILIQGDSYFILPLVQDYKKIVDDSSPMTHGTAAVATSGPYPKELIDNIEKYVVEPTISGLKEEGIVYSSILYIGLMIEKNQPQVLEYNVRSGNPEWLSIMGLLNTPLIEALYYPSHSHWNQGSSLTSFIMAKDYPEVTRDLYKETITGMNKIFNCDIFGESIIKRDNEYYPSGGRILAIRDSNLDFNIAKLNVLKSINEIQLDGKKYRSDLREIKFI